jgi:hypothetical protein
MRNASPAGFVRIRPVRLYLAALALASLSAPVAHAQSSSVSYVLQQSTTNDGGEVSDSAGYRLAASLGQEATIGTSSSVSYVLQSGFWSFVGSGLVPVILMVDKNAGTPGNVDLTWSGNNPPYDIYQATDCTSVFSRLFDTSVTNEYPNITPPGDDLVCYNVLATAPGPAPPGGVEGSKR